MCKFGAKSDANKASKYLKRLFAHHHEGMWFGEVVERRNGCIAVHMENGARLNLVIREVGYDQAGHALDDGIQYMTVSGFRALTGKRVAPGFGYQITALEASGLIKGHVEIVEDNDLAAGVDGIFIGPKKQVKALGNRFTIGFLQEIHGRDTPPFTAAYFDGVKAVEDLIEKRITDVERGEASPQSVRLPEYA